MKNLLLLSCFVLSLLQLFSVANLSATSSLATINKPIFPTNTSSDDCTFKEGAIPSVLNKYPSLFCRWVPAPQAQKQICCLDRSHTAHNPTGNMDQDSATLDSHRCLPNAFVIGTQKSGTTPLFMYLLFHPEFVYCERGKELHYFDDTRKFKRGASFYLSLMPIATRVNPIAIGEFNSPTMKASHPANDLNPSEVDSSSSLKPDEGHVNNKTTGVGSQISKHQADVYKITVDITPSYLPALEACPRIKELVPHAKLVVILRDPVKRAWSEILMKVRMEESKKIFHEYIQNHAVKAYGCTEKLMQNSGLEAQQEAIFATKFEQCFGLDVPENCYQRFKLFAKKLAKNKRGWKKCFVADAENKWRIATVKQCGAIAPKMMSKSSGQERIGDKIKHIRFHGDPSSLHDGTINAILENEADTINQCFARLRGKELNESKTKYYRRCSSSSIHAPSDISHGFLWRGLYYHQLESCMKYFDKSRFLILESDEMRFNTTDALKRFLNHTGFSYVDLTKTTSEERQALFDSKFPSFEEVTGWRDQGSMSSQMPDSVRRQLIEFYRPYNQLLFDFLGRVYKHWS